MDLLNRPGADFTDLPAAVAAAGPGDTIELRPIGSLQPVYSAPTVQGKGLTIRGTGAQSEVRVSGSFLVQSLPAHQTMCISSLTLTTRIPIEVVSLRCVACRGTIALDNLGGLGYPNFGNVSGFFDCDLVTIHGCALDWVYPWPVDHTNLMISDSTIRGVTFQSAGGAALNVSDSTVTLSRTALYGSSIVDSRWPFTQAPAIQALRSVLRIGAGCYLAAGTHQDGSPGAYSAVYSQSSDANDTTTIVIDFDEVRTRGGWSGTLGLAYQVGPQTSLGFSMSSTSLDVDQFVHEGALTVLAIGEPQTVPWTSAVGPVFVNPVGLFACFDFGVARMTLRRTLPIPPGLPVGTHVALQAFELLPDGTSLGSNVAIAGIW